MRNVNKDIVDNRGFVTINLTNMLAKKDENGHCVIEDRALKLTSLKGLQRITFVIYQNIPNKTSEQLVKLREQVLMVMTLTAQTYRKFEKNTKSYRYLGTSVDVNDILTVPSKAPNYCGTTKKALLASICDKFIELNGFKSSEKANRYEFTSVKKLKDHLSHFNGDRDLTKTDYADITRRGRLDNLIYLEELRRRGVFDLVDGNEY